MTLCCALVWWALGLPQGQCSVYFFSLAEGLGDTEELSRKHLLNNTELGRGGRLVEILPSRLPEDFALGGVCVEGRHQFSGPLEGRVLPVLVCL